MQTSKEMQAQISTADLMRLADWQEVKSYQDITYHKAEGIARIAFRPAQYPQRLPPRDHR